MALEIYDDNGRSPLPTMEALTLRIIMDCNNFFCTRQITWSETFNMPCSVPKNGGTARVLTEAGGIIQEYSNDYLDMAPLTSEQPSRKAR